MEVLRYFFGRESKKRQMFIDPNDIKYLGAVLPGYHNRGDPWAEQRYSGD